jgi:hypothetical protein
VNRQFKRKFHLTIATSVVWLGSSFAFAIEEPGYVVVEQFGEIELRAYDEIVLAETRVDADFERAGNRAFRSLFGYLSRKNKSQAKIEMTAPVVQQFDERGWRVAFIVPQVYSWQNAPEPTDPEVLLRLVPERTVAALRFSGSWSEERFKAKERELRDQMAARGWEPDGPAIFARYDPPFKPWFLRRNEVHIPIRSESHPGR